MAMEQLSQRRISGRRTGEDQSVAEGGDEGWGCSVLETQGSAAGATRVEEESESDVALRS
jgi:hypothetical protein